MKFLNSSFIVQWTTKRAIKLRNEATIAVFVVNKPFPDGNLVSDKWLGTNAEGVFFRFFHGEGISAL